MYVENIMSSEAFDDNIVVIFRSNSITKIKQR